MENNLRINLIALKNAPGFAKIAISIYWIASLLVLFFVVDEIFTDKTLRGSISDPDIPVNIVHTVIMPLVAAWFVFAALKLFLAFKLTMRKNWARITVMIVSALLAVALSYPAYTAVINRFSFFVVFKIVYWPVAEMVAASLLLLPKSRGWFAPDRTSA